MDMPTLTATFHPQQWVNDHAMDSAPSFEFDAAAALLALTAQQVRFLAAQTRERSGRDLDHLAEAANLVGDGPEQHNGPYRVTLDADELDAFLSAVGLDDLPALTDADVARIRMTGPDPFRESVIQDCVDHAIDKADEGDFTIDGDDMEDTAIEGYESASGETLGEREKTEVKVRIARIYEERAD